MPLSARNCSLLALGIRRFSALSASESVRSGLDAVAALAREEALQERLRLRQPRKTPALLAADNYFHHFKHKVAIFTRNGEVSIHHRTGRELNITVRDMPLLGTARDHAHHATISLRDDKMLVRTEILRAIVQRDSLVLFECRRATLSEKVGTSVLNVLRASQKQRTSIPFELQVLEVLLDQTVTHFEDKCGQLKLLSNAVLEDINLRISSADIRRMLPLQKAVTALEYDISETKHAIREVATSEKRLAALCLSEDQHLVSGPPQDAWSPQMQLAHRLLMSFDNRIRSLHSTLRELTEHMDSTREVWHMQLDAMRNRIIRLNLHLEFAGIATMVSVAPAALFGMNLVSGLEETPGVFWYVTAGTAASGVSVYTFLWLYYTAWPLRNTRKRMSDMTALQDLLMYNVDEFGEILEALRKRQERPGKISKQEFETIVHTTLGDSQSVGDSSRSKVDLLYRVLDKDRDGELDTTELTRAHQGAVYASQHSDGDWENVQETNA